MNTDNLTTEEMERLNKWAEYCKKLPKEKPYLKTSFTEDADNELLESFKFHNT